MSRLEKLVDRATYSKRPNDPRTRDQRPRPRASADQIAAWQALANAYQGALRLQEEALRGSELDLSEYDVLVTLAHAPPEGIRPTELAERVLLTKSGVTRLVDRLSQRGLIERRACPSDRRGQLIALTPKGRHRLRRAAPGLLRGLATALAPLSSAELSALRGAAERVKEATTAHSPA